MTTSVCKLDVKPGIRFISRWDVEMRQAVSCYNREADLLAVAADGSIAPAMLDEGWPT